MATKGCYAVEAPNNKHQIANRFQWSEFQTEEELPWSYIQEPPLLSEGED
jgi:hypothetical protein